MREIKFRFWDDRMKQMDFPDSIANNIDADRFNIMQYTGLKDKNGKEIYEGDHIAYGVARYIVIYEGCGFVARKDNVTSSICSMCEIIGNIYENLELLKKE